MAEIIAADPELAEVERRPCQGSRLMAAGKPVKSALTATARKLLGVLNAMLTTGTDYRPTNSV